MAALTADDVTVTLLPEDVDFTQQLRKLNLVTLSFGDGSKTYPSGGIPLPDKGRFGMSREIRFMLFADPNNGYLYVYDRTHHKLRIYFPDGANGVMEELAATEAPEATSLEALVLGE